MSEGAVWFVGEGDQQVGPMDLATLRARLTDGKHGGGTLVWREGMGEWERADGVSGVKDLFAGAAPPAMGGGGVGAGVVVPRSRDSTSNLFAILSYVSYFLGLPFWLFPIVPLAMKRDAFSVYHAKQALTLIIVIVVAAIVSVPLMFVAIGFLTIFAALIIGLVLAILGIVNAANGAMKPLPLIGGWAEAWWSGIQANEGAASL